MPYSLDSLEYPDSLINSNQFDVGIINNYIPVVDISYLSHTWPVVFNKINSDISNNFKGGIYYKTPFTGEYNFTANLSYVINFHLNASLTYRFFLHIDIFKNGVSFISNTITYNVILTDHQITDIQQVTTGLIECSAGDTFDVRINLYPYYQTSFQDVQLILDSNSTFNCIINKNIIVGGKIFMSQLMPDLGQDELLKILAQKYGIIFIPDDDVGIIYCRLWEDLYKNMAIAKDWSDKFDCIVNEDIEFSDSNYSQKNWFKYETDQFNSIDELGDSYFTINNENLPQENTIIQLSIAATEEVERFGGLNICQIKKLAINTQTPPVPVFKNNTQIRLVQLNCQNDPHGDGTKFKFNDPSVGFLNPANYPLTYFNNGINPQGFNNLISKYYPDFVNGLMTNYKKITCNFKLSIRDVINYNINPITGEPDLIPIYVKKLSAYFYINKISNFVEGQKTTVELVKL
jgi:hypothetical protein